MDRSLNYGRDCVARFLREAKSLSCAVDLGAGTGEDLALVRQLEAGAELHGVEINEDNARQLEAVGIMVHRLDIERDVLPFADGSVDVVILNQILEHTKEIFWILGESSRVLRIGGTLIIGVPNLAAWHNRILLLLGRQPRSIRPHSAHVRGFTKPDMLRLVNECFPGGYALEGFGGGNFYPFLRIAARLFASLFPTLAVGIFFSFVKRRDYGGEFTSYPAARRLETNFYTGPKN